MSSDLEENGIQTRVGTSQMKQNVKDFDLPGSANDLEQLVTHVDGPWDRVSNTLLSSNFQSTTNRLSRLFSGPTPPMFQSVMTNGDWSKSESPLTTLTEGFNLPSMADQIFPDAVFGIVDGMESVRNSTASFLETSSETVFQEYASWSPEEIGGIIIVSLMVPFMLLSNACVIICVVRFRRLHTPTNYFITSLAAVDIFVAVATPLGVAVEVFNFGGAVRPGHVVLCLLPNRVLMMACGVSVLTLATIAYDRQTALVSPLEYVNIMTSRKVAVMVILTWMYSALIVWLPLIVGWYDLPSEVLPCSANLIHGKAPVLFFSAIFVPSCVAIFVCYFRIFLVARHHAKAIAAVEFAVHRNLQVKFMIKDTKYAKTLAMVIGVFLFLWLPYLIFILVQTISSRRFYIWIQTYLILLTVFNSGINPWVYAFKNNELRAALKRLFKEFCRHKLCKFDDRRTSLESAASGTPRLSRTDSRIASIIPEVTLYTVCGKLGHSLDYLGQQVDENKHGVCGRQQQRRRQTLTNDASHSSSLECFKQFHKYATSCSNLEALGSRDRRSRSFSVDLALPTNVVEQKDVEVCHLGDLYHTLPVGDLYPELAAPGKTVAERVYPGASVNEQSNYNYDTCISRRPNPLSSTSASSTSLMSSSLSSIHTHPPPSLRRFSISNTPPSTLSSMIHVLEPKQHPVSVAHITNVPTDHPSIPPHRPLRYTHSFNYLKQAVQPAMPWNNTSYRESPTEATSYPYCPQPLLPRPCPNVSDSVTTSDQPTFAHIHSCPIFEPISRYKNLLPQVWADHVASSHLRKVSSAFLEDRLDFVSLVNKEAADCSRKGRYLV